MTQDTFTSFAPRAALGSRPRSGGFATIGTLILASVSAIALVLLSGCHSTPASNAGSSAFAGTAADKAVEERLRQRDTMPPLQPFDEHLGAELVSAE